MTIVVELFGRTPKDLELKNNIKKFKKLLKAKKYDKSPKNKVVSELLEQLNS